MAGTDSAEAVQVFDADGSPVALTTRLGEGGQGKVYRMAEGEHLLAKLYKNEEDFAEKRPRLKALLALDSPQLAKVAAWPTRPLMDARGETVGFVMENLKGWVPLHKVYQLKSRLGLLPDADFGFLVRVARNLATCVHYMHEAEIVIGDLNESNVFASGNAMVKLIDADSVQIQAADGRLFTCDVGRPELIAPELQGHSLSKRPRRKEEDRFALAVLIFQTLTFGRHPFAGRPRGSEELSLETAIEHRLYVYHSQGNSRMTPPPGLDLAFLNDELRGMFDRAFGGEPAERPTAIEWFDVLERFEKSLVKCERTNAHAYAESGSGCPWCRMEDDWRIALFGAERKIAKLGPELDLERIWSEIEGVPLPSTYEVPSPIKLEAVEAAKVRRAWMFNMTSWIIFASILVQVAMQWLAVSSSMVSIWLVAPLWVVCLGLVAGVAYYGNAQVRSARKAFDEANERFKQLLDEWADQAATEVFESTKTELVDARERLTHLDGVREARIQRELVSTYGYELNNYLRKYSILVADIGGANKAVLGRLNDNGIKTAADIDESLLATDRHNVSGPVIRDLVAWRKSLEAAFWSTSPYRLSGAHLQRVDRELAAEVEGIRRRLRKGARELGALSEDLMAHQRHLGPQLHDAHYRAMEAAKTYKAWLNATGRTAPISE